MNDGVQNGLAMAAISLASMVAGLFFGWLKDRDKLRSGEEITAIKAQNTVQAGQIAAQAGQIAALTAEHATCREETAQTKQQLKECAEQHRTTELRLADIERALADKKDRTDDHRPL